MDRRKGILRGFATVVVALTLCLAAGFAVATPAGAVVSTTEFPTNYRPCGSTKSSSGVYKFDYCLSVGFVHTNPRRHVGQVTMACRTVSGNRLVNCRSMTNNAATLYGNYSGGFDAVRQ